MSMDLSNLQEDDKIQEQLFAEAKKKEFIKSLLPFFGLVFLVVLFTIVTGGSFLKTGNLMNIISQSFTLVIVAAGGAFVYAHGGIDMSLGSVQAVAAIIFVLTAVAGLLPMWTLLPLSILVGIIFTGSIGLLYRLLSVPAFIVSLCLNYIATGILRTLLARNRAVLNYEEFAVWNNWFLRAGILIVLVGSLYYLYEYTRVGKRLRALGGNKNTAEQSGVNSLKYTVLAYAILGLCVGLTAFFATTRTGMVARDTGAGLQFDLLTAIMLGGFNLGGGTKSRFRAALLGALLIVVLTNGLILWGLDPNLLTGIKGVLFLTVIFISSDRSGAEVTMV